MQQIKISIVKASKVLKPNFFRILKKIEKIYMKKITLILNKYNQILRKILFVSFKNFNIINYLFFNFAQLFKIFVHKILQYLSVDIY